MKFQNILNILIFNILIASCEYSTQSTASSSSELSAPVKTIEVVAEDALIYKSYYGQVQYTQGITYIAEISGRVNMLNINPGQRVSGGEVLITFPPMHHSLEIEQATLAYQELHDQFQRQKMLFEKGAVSRISLNQLKTQLDVQEKVMSQSQRVNLITAPYSGIITEVFVNLGQAIVPGQPIFSMAKVDRIQVEFFVPEKDIEAIKPGESVNLIHEKGAFTGSITHKAIQMDLNHRAYRVIASFDNSQQFNLAGRTMELKVTLEKLADVVLIPEETVLHQGASSYVFLASQGKAKKKRISIGKRVGFRVLVEEGIQPGDLLISAGLQRLKHDNPIDIID